MQAILKVLFSSAARVRSMTRYFRRSVILEHTGHSLASLTPSVSMQSAGKRLLELAAIPLESLYTRLHSSPDGLSEETAKDVRARVGINAVEHDRAPGWWLHLWLAYRDPFNLLLSALAGLSWLTDVRWAVPGEQDWVSVIIISAMVLISTLLRFIQERRSNHAVEALRAMVTNTVHVWRPLAASQNMDREDDKEGNGHGDRAHKVEVPLAYVVPGDVVLLSAGDMIPADCRMLSAKDLFVSQAALTGESLPVEKFAVSRTTVASPLELDNIGFMGTTVVSGSATALVLATGDTTYFGELARKATAITRTPTQFQQGITRISWVLIRFMFLMAPVVFLVNGLTKGDWLQALLFALAVAVGLTPEMLPMIVTSTLAKGAVMMARKKVVAKRLDAIQDLGAMNILCTDKTGTLTQDRIILARHTDVYGTASDEVLAYAYLNSHYQTGLKNLLDVAVLEHAEIKRALNLSDRYAKIDEIPFDFARRRMSVVVSKQVNGYAHHALICKGAFEEMMQVCGQVKTADGIKPLDEAVRADIRRITNELNSEGLRVIAVGVKELPPLKNSYSVADEADLILIGYVAFLDPPKDSTAPALRALMASGIEVKVLTGDVERVTQKVCRDVGLKVRGVLLASEIERMDDRQLAQAVQAATIFARLTPAHKARIVRCLRVQGNTVGFLGDGINDAPALRAADVGISVDTAVDIAKEAADIILLEKSLLVLEDGVLEGRRTFCNMLKYLKMTASSNFGNVFSVLIASVLLPFLPMLPIQLLLQNLLYDFSQIAIPFDQVDEELLREPQRWDPAGLGRFMVFFGPLSSVFDLITFAVLWYVFQANTLAAQGLFQSGWFVEGLLSQTLIVHMIRTRKVPFVQSRAAWPLLGTTLIIMALGLVLPFSPLASYFEMQALPSGYFLWLGIILLGYVALTQIVKNQWLRRYGWQ